MPSLHYDIKVSTILLLLIISVSCYGYQYGITCNETNETKNSFFASHLHITIVCTPSEYDISIDMGKLFIHNPIYSNQLNIPSHIQRLLSSLKFTISSLVFSLSPKMKFGAKVIQPRSKAQHLIYWFLKRQNNKFTTRKPRHLCSICVPSYVFIMHSMGPFCV